MKILITGVTGFIGSHLAERLILEGNEVWAIVRATSDIDALPSNILKNISFLTINENNTIYDIVSELDKSGNIPDIVYHLASLYLSQHQPEDINELIASNITFGTNLLEAMVGKKVNKIVWAGTSWQHYENAEYNPVNLYAATKEAFDDIAKYYTEACRVRGISLKLFDTYGVSDTRKKLMSLLMDGVKSGDKIELSPGMQKIDLVYIDDVVNAFLVAGKLLMSDTKVQFANYGVSSGNPITIRELVKQIEKITQKKLNVIWGVRPYRKREVMNTWEKYQTLPGWEPKINLETGVLCLLKN